jgi:tetratricopeptide (TPR) repeat protein
LLRTGPQRRTFTLLGAAVLLVCLPIGTAIAQSDDSKVKAQKLSQQATKDYELSRFQIALDGYEKAYALYPVPGLLFNIGQCYMGLEDREQALVFFERYLEEMPDAKNRPLVEDLIAEAKRKRRNRRPTFMPDVSGATTPKPTWSRSIPFYKKWWFWAAVGSAAVIAGGTMYYFSGETRAVLPAGSVGTLDRR